MSSTIQPSQSPLLSTLATGTAIIPITFGINALFRPHSALSILGFPSPASPADRALAHGLVAIYGARDIFSGAAIIATVAFGSPRALGCVLLSAAGVAAVEGVVARVVVGTGEWGHWVFVPILGAMGAAFLGVLDTRR
jgi:hypothetical protein